MTAANNSPTGLEFQITGTKLYIPVITLSKKNPDKMTFRRWFKRTVKWNKYKSQMTIQSHNNNLNYLIDLTFTKVNRLFVLSFARTSTGVQKNSFSHYYVPSVRIRDFNVLIDGKSFSDLPVKEEEEAYENVMSDDRNNDCTTGNLLDFAYFKKKLQTNCNWFEQPN